jgi:hypothetical protein
MLPDIIRAKIFDLKRQWRCGCSSRLPELEDFAGSEAEEQEKIIRELRRDREVIKPFKSSQARIHDRPAKTCFAKRAGEGGRGQKEEEAMD